jgi:hypothetical protein
MATIQEIKAKFEDARATMKREGEAAVKENFGAFFSRHPEVSSVVWTQYTPYFNDGDTCEFGVHEPELKLTREFVDGNPDAIKSLLRYQTVDDLVESKYHYGDASAHKLPSIEPDFAELLRPIFGLSELMEQVFGDHVKVVVTREGFQVDEYQHD